MNIPPVVPSSSAAVNQSPRGLERKQSSGEVQANGEAQPTSAETTKVSEKTREALDGAVSSMNDLLGTLGHSLRFNIDDETGKTIVKVMDSQTQEVIKQIPSEEMLAIAKALDKLQGLLVKQKA